MSLHGAVLARGRLDSVSLKRRCAWAQHRANSIIQGFHCKMRDMLLLFFFTVIFNYNDTRDSK